MNRMDDNATERDWARLAHFYSALTYTRHHTRRIPGVQFYSVTHTRHNYIPVCIPGGYPEYSDPLRGDFLTEVVIYHTCIRAGGRAPPGLIPSQHSRCACACASLVFNRGRDLLPQELRAIMEKLLACGCNELVQQSMQRIFGDSTSGRPVQYPSSTRLVPV